MNAAGVWVKDAENFGKIHRFYYPPVHDFEKVTLAKSAKGKTLKEWRKLLFPSKKAKGKSPKKKAPDLG